MHAQIDLADLGGIKIFGVADLHATVDRRVDDDAAGERLVGVGEDFVALAQSFGNFVEVVRGAEDVGPATLGLDRLFRAGIAPGGEQRRGKTVLRGPAGMKTLRHGPEHFAQAHRLGRGKAERPGQVLRVEP